MIKNIQNSIDCSIIISVFSEFAELNNTFLLPSSSISTMRFVVDTILLYPAFCRRCKTAKDSEETIEGMPHYHAYPSPCRFIVSEILIKLLPFCNGYPMIRWEIERRIVRLKYPPLVYCTYSFVSKIIKHPLSDKMYQQQIFRYKTFVPNS